jgi:hypothetical protein
LGVVAAIMAASFLWLALDGGRGGPSGIQGRDSMASATALLPSASAIPQFNLPASVSPSWTSATAMNTSPGASSDNLTMLVLGGATVLAVAGFAVLKARRRRPDLGPVALAEVDRSPALVQFTPDQAILSR